MCFRKLFLLFSPFLVALYSSAEIKYGLRDESGRHIVARGYVVTTNDGMGEVFWDADDYSRMVRMGANYQVIRLELGKLSHFPGADLKGSYLRKLDHMVALGREAGLKTILKMTVYTVEGFSWEDFWLNEKGEQDLYLEAWKVIWERYKDEVSVMGYDLLNEPRKLEMDISYDDLTTKYLIPCYQMLIDEKNKIDAYKSCILQAIFMNKGEAIEHNQYAEFKASIDRPNIFFSPHIYLDNADWLEPVLERQIKESTLLKAPMFIGEWGFPTYSTTDVSVEAQQKDTLLYIKTAEAFDRLGVGTIKAWFSGNRTMQNFLPGGPSTWAIFSDEKDVGTVERKYITDVIARPYPQAVAGDIRSFRYDFSTRTLEVSLRTDNGKGTSQIFVGADRHYPDGFTVQMDDELALFMNPLAPKGLEVLKSGPTGNPNDFIWNEARQQLLILQWPMNGVEMVLKVTPGMTLESSP